MISNRQRIFTNTSYQIPIPTIAHTTYFDQRNILSWTSEGRWGLLSAIHHTLLWQKQDPYKIELGHGHICKYNKNLTTFFAR